MILVKSLDTELVDHPKQDFYVCHGRLLCVGAKKEESKIVVRFTGILPSSISIEAEMYLSVSFS